MMQQRLQPQWLTCFVGLTVLLSWISVDFAVASEAAEGAGQVQSSAPLPPVDSPVLLRTVQLQFPNQGNVSSVDGVTYLYYMELKDHVSLPSQDKWVPYTDSMERMIKQDFLRLWETGFLEDIWIEVVDEPWPNGVGGKRVIFNMEERERVKLVTYEGSDELDRGDIEGALAEAGFSVRIDSFLDEGRIRQIKGVLLAMFAEKGYQFAEIDHVVAEVAGGPKVVQLTFDMEAGPKVHVEEIEFIGNTAMSDGELKSKMKNTKERSWLSWLTRRGTYKEALYEEDAELVIAHYRNRGFIEAQVGQPEVEYLDESEDKKERGVRLRVPVQEGERYRVGDVNFDGNDVLADSGLTDIFRELEPGQYYSEDEVRKAFDAAREVYGQRGYYEMTLFPDLQPRIAHEANADGNGNGDEEPASLAEERPLRMNGNPIVDVTIRVQEGDQYFVNLITFQGNKTTHDEVIRRNIQLVEHGVFNTEALKYSVRRLNQLGFFEPIEETGVEIEKTEEADNEVDLTFDLTEQNLNQLTFGAGVSQFEGFFGQLAFQTSNFMGRGEQFSIGLQHGSRVKNYNLGFTEPFLFGRNLSAGMQVYSREVEWIGVYTDDTTGASFTVGWPLSYFSRLFLSYSYDATRVSDISPFLMANPETLAFNPFFQDALLLGGKGRRTVGKFTPSISLNTVDHPIFPNTGKKLLASLALAGFGGNTKFWKPTLAGTWYVPHTTRTTIGFRVQYEHLSAGDPDQIPIFERLWSGGEYSIRGFDIRRIGPTISDLNPEVSEETYQGRTVMGGNKSLLFNAEYQFTIAGPVRLIAFYDTGQVQDFGQKFAPGDFKTSTGLELRIFMPMLNIPFRLIYAWNLQRDGIYNDDMVPQEKTAFRFAVGTTF